MQHHQTHLNHYKTIQRNRKADEEDQIEIIRRQQQRQELAENMALRRLRVLQQQQQQQQQPLLLVEEEEETPPNDLPDVIRPPPRPQKEPGMHRMLMEFEQEQSTKWKRRKSIQPHQVHPCL